MPLVHNCTIFGALDGAEFIRRIRRVGRKRNVPVRFDPRRGRGSHGTLYYGDRLTTVKDRKKEIRKGLLHATLRQLGLTFDDIS